MNLENKPKKISNMLAIAKAVLRRKFLALKYLDRKERFLLDNISIYLII